MQKRTNPLELKMDAKAAKAAMPPAKSVQDESPVSAVLPEEERVTPAMPAPVKEAPVRSETPKAVEKPSEAQQQPATPPPVKKRAAVEMTTTEPQEAVDQTETELSANDTPMTEEVHWQRMAPSAQIKKVEAKVEQKTEQANVEVAPITQQVTIEVAPIIPQQDTYEQKTVPAQPENDPVTEILEPLELDDIVSTEEQHEEHQAPTEEFIEDEEQLLLEDFRMAARFSMTGHISRRMTTGKISRDLCRLAQLMHPDQKLSTILENALLTRIYLENPDAFDAMVEAIEKKGGHIKC